MGFVGVVIGAAGTAIFYYHDRLWLAVLAGIVTAITFWSYGVMHNYAVEHASRRANYNGGFADFTVNDMDAIPDRLAMTNMAATVIALILLIVAVVGFWWR